MLGFAWSAGPESRFTTFGSSFFPTPADPRASADIGVGQCFTTIGNESPELVPFDRPSDALAVGHIAIARVWSIREVLMGFPLILGFCPGSHGSILLPADSAARGVDQSGHDPHPVSLVRGPDRPSTHHERPCGVPEFFQRSEYVVNPPSSQSRYVLSQHPTRSCRGDESPHLPPQAGSLGVDAAASSGAGDVLAREPSDHSIDCPKLVSLNVTHILHPWNVGPVLRQHGTAVRVDLYLPGAGPARTLKAQVEAAYPGEERQEPQITPPPVFASPAACRSICSGSGRHTPSIAPLPWNRSVIVSP